MATTLQMNPRPCTLGGDDERSLLQLQEIQLKIEKNGCIYKLFLSLCYVKSILSLHK